jgi:prophage antirepressor-like protein
MTFEFDGLPIRTLTRNGNPWFVAKDVAEVLGYSNPQKAVRDHCKRPEPAGVNESFTPLDPQTILIPEADIYRLVLRSKLPAAERFETWVVEEVLPQIRRTGSYTVEGNLITLTPAQMFLRAAQVMEAQERAIAELKAEVTEVRAEADAVKEVATVLQHRVDNLDLTNIEGTPRQRLGKMVNRYSYQNGITYRSGWNEFVSRFNTAYKTNLTARIQNYTRANGLKKEPSVPEYLEAVNQLEDGIRVADKMLNQQRVG